MLSACGSDDNGNTPTRGLEKIEVFIDSAITPETYNQYIVTADIPLEPTTGFTNMFLITSQNTSSANFSINFGPSIIFPFTITIPSSETINGSISQFLSIDGIVFDDTAANNLNINYLQFGSNTGDNIEFEILGTYYEQNSVTAHNIKVIVNITRD